VGSLAHPPLKVGRYLLLRARQTDAKALGEMQREREELSCVECDSGKERVFEYHLRVTKDVPTLEINSIITKIFFNIGIVTISLGILSLVERVREI